MLADGSRFPSKYVTADGVRIHYQESGKGVPLVCIHGTSPGAFGWGDFHRNIDHFQQAFRTVWFDLPQYGSSDKPIVKGDRLAFTANLINLFLEAIDITSAHFVGVSMGGQIALKLAIEYPERVDRLVVVGSAPIRDSLFLPIPKETIRLTQSYYRDSGPSVNKMTNLLQSMVQNQSVITDEFVKMRFEASNRPEVVELFTKHRPQAEDLYPELELIRAKTLIVWGQDDRASGLDGALLLLRKLQDAQLHVFASCGHWVHFDRSEDFNRLAVSFCNENS